MPETRVAVAFQDTDGLIVVRSQRNLGQFSVSTCGSSQNFLPCALLKTSPAPGLGFPSLPSLPPPQGFSFFYITQPFWLRSLLSPHLAFWLNHGSSSLSPSPAIGLCSSLGLLTLSLLPFLIFILTPTAQFLFGLDSSRCLWLIFSSYLQ